MKKIIVPQLIGLSILVMACTFTWPLHPSTPVAAEVSPTVEIPTTLPPPPTPSWSLYKNAKFGFSVGHPNTLPVNVQSEEYIEIGDKIVLSVSTVDPTSLRGDGPVYETATDVQPARYLAKLYTGYLGSVGGYVPQQIRMYVFQNNGNYIAFTLYALGLKATGGDVTRIIPIYPEDESIFDNIVTSLEFN